MKQYDITLDPADLDAIAAGSTVTVHADDVTFEVSSQDAWTGPAFSGGVCRLGLSDRELTTIRLGQRLLVLPVAGGRVWFTADQPAAVR